MIEAQKQGKIVIKRADKGGATVIMNREDYVKGVEKHLMSTIENSNGETINVYREVHPIMLDVHKEQIKRTVNEAWTFN